MHEYGGGAGVDGNIFPDERPPHWHALMRSGAEHGALLCSTPLIAARTLRQLGAHTSRRAVIWQQCLGVEVLQLDEPVGVFEWLLQQPASGPFDDLHCIDMDIPRTFPNRSELHTDEAEQRLRSVLLAYARRNPHIGYMSGMSCIAMMLIDEMDAEAAFWCFASVMEVVLPGLFCVNHRRMSFELELFDRLVEVRLPQLATHFKRLDITSCLYASIWFKTLFTYSAFPEDKKIFILDAVFAQGADVLHHVGLQILSRFERSLLQCGFEAVLYFLNREMSLANVDFDFFCVSSFKDMPSVSDMRRSCMSGQELHICSSPQEQHICSLVLVWSPESHLRFKHWRRNAVLAVLMLQARSGTILCIVPRRIWIECILPYT